MFFLVSLMFPLKHNLFLKLMTSPMHSLQSESSSHISWICICLQLHVQTITLAPKPTALFSTSADFPMPSYHSPFMGLGSEKPQEQGAGETVWLQAKERVLGSKGSNGKGAELCTGSVWKGLLQSFISARLE